MYDFIIKTTLRKLKVTQAERHKKKSEREMQEKSITKQQKGRDESETDSETE